MSLLPSRPDSSPPDDAEPRVIGVDSEDADEVLSALSSETARKLLAELHDDPAPPSELADRVDTSLQNAQYHLEKLEKAGAVAVVDTAYSAKGREMDMYAPADQPLVIFAGDDDDSSLLRSALSRLLGAVGILGLASLAIQQLYGESLLGGGEDGGVSGGGQSGGDGAPAADGGQGGDAMSEGGADGTDATATETAEPTPVETADGGDGGGVTSMDVGESGTVEPSAETTERIADATATATETAVNATQTVTQTATDAADATREVATGLPPGLVFFAGGLFAIVLVAGVVYLR